MKVKDIEVGGEYAYDRSRDPWHPERVRVLAVGVERQGRRSWNPPTYDGVRVQPLNDRGKPRGEERLVITREIHCTWAEWTERYEARLADEEEGRRQRHEAERACVDRWAAMLPVLDRLGIPRPPVAEDWIVGDLGEITERRQSGGPPVEPGAARRATVEVPVGWLLRLIAEAASGRP